MLSRRTFQLALAGTATSVLSGCMTAATQPGPAAPTLGFGDFALISHGGGGISRELRVFTDGAGVLLNGAGAVGGMLEPKTMERLRRLIESPEFHDHLTRPLDETAAKVCGGTVASFKTTFRMGELIVDVPCVTQDRPTLVEFTELLAPYGDPLLARYGDRGFPAPLPDGQPELPVINVQELHDGDDSRRPRYDLEPDGTVTRTGPGPGAERTKHRISAPRLDGLRAILRNELRPPARQSHEFALRVQVGASDPVVVPQSGALSAETASLDYQSIALIVATKLGD